MGGWVLERAFSLLVAPVGLLCRCSSGSSNYSILGWMHVCLCPAAPCYVAEHKRLSQTEENFTLGVKVKMFHRANKLDSVKCRRHAYLPPFSLPVRVCYCPGWLLIPATLSASSFVDNISCTLSLLTLCVYCRRTHQYK